MEIIILWVSAAERKYIGVISIRYSYTITLTISDTNFD